MAYDEESRIDEMERDRLQKVISDVETAKSVSTPGTRGELERFLGNARARVGELDRKIKDAKIEREARARDEVVLAQMAEREAKLSTAEKKTFSGFLVKEFFTKNDFGALDQFYAKTWDRLSEEGKTAMSTRVWGGIRRDEYTFTELPKAVREKEMEQAYAFLKKADGHDRDATNIPQRDRDDFTRAYEDGKLEEAGKILKRTSFKENMFRNLQSRGVKQAKLEAVRDAEGAELGENIATSPTAAASAPEKHDESAIKDLSAFELNGVQLVDVAEQGSSRDIPDAKGGKGGDGRSLPG